MRSGAWRVYAAPGNRLGCGRSPSLIEAARQCKASMRTPPPALRNRKNVLIPRMSRYQGTMPSSMFAPIARRPSLPRAAAVIALLALGLALAGCASSVGDLGDNMTAAFANPSTYDFYDCKQLQDARKGINNRIDETKRLMAKAETGVAGPVVAEIVYRQDYIAYRGQLKFIDEYWARNK